MSKFLRTCLKCGVNLYSPAEYKTHLQDKHGKMISKSDVSEPRKVQSTLAHTGQDVPEDVLVKPKKVDAPTTDVAKSRKRTIAADKTKDTKTVAKPRKKTKRKKTRKATQKPSASKE